MWMMGYNDGSDSFNGGRKLRPLIPRPLPSSTSTSSSNLPPCLGRIHGTDLFALNQHMAVVEQNKKELNDTQQVVVSSRWNPTPEQLRTLEELYQRGTRTPSADEIQHITAQLRRYGKIEGKNVFYWFQNHKARERQKRRRQILESDVQHFESKESGASRTGYEVEQTKNWAPSTNCTTLSEESPGSTERSAKAMVEECRTTDGWIQLDERRDNIVQRNDTWHVMQSLSCPPHTHLINTTITTSTEGPTTTSAATTMDQNVLKTHDLNIFLRPFRSEPNCLNHINSVGSAVSCCNNINIGYGDGSCGESQTLQLFPLRSEENMKEKEEIDLSVAALNSNFTTPYQFFEFLPLKN